MMTEINIIVSFCRNASESAAIERGAWSATNLCANY